MRSASGRAESNASGATRARLPGTHVGSMGLSQGRVRREQKRPDPYAFALLLDRLVRGPYPSPTFRLLWKAGRVPEQPPAGLALRLQVEATPVQKGEGDPTERTTGDQAKRHLFANRIAGRSLLPQHARPGQGGWRAGSPFGPHWSTKRTGWSSSCQAGRRGRAKRLPQTRVQKAKGPTRLQTGPSHQAVTGLFLPW